MKTAKPVRVGIFDSVQGVEKVVSELLDAGFTKDQLAVICSEPAVVKHFVDEGLQDEQPADPRVRAEVGGVIGSTLGGIGFIGLATSSGLSILAAGALLPAILGGGIAGSFLGAMTSRGVDREAADFYDQAVEEGKLLVVAENRSKDADTKLHVAEAILSESGIKPAPLSDS